MNDKLLDFIQINSPDGGFLQSEHWKNFQKSVGRNTYALSAKDNGETIAYANILTHNLPVVGDYFYTPRGPITIQNSQLKIRKYNAKLKFFLSDLINLAKRRNIGWIRIEPASEEILQVIKENLPKNFKVNKSSVDMQSREILMLDISKSEEEILAGMKQKTRYNIKLAEKKGVKIYDSREKKHIDELLRLVKITSERDKITPHPGNYYRKMLEAIPPEILKLYVAEFEGKIIAANLVLFFGKTATYMHGASDNEYRNAMAPYLLQWRQIQDAKKVGCIRYDLGGVNTKYQIPNTKYNSWFGITKFKAGFAPVTEPVRFPGCWDIVLSSGKYGSYRILQKIKRIF